MTRSLVLGIWDGHDAGAALVENGRVLFAVNEERLSRRKLDIGFPVRSIEACLRAACLQPSSVQMIAASTSDPAKTLTRLFPRLQEEYYLLRRRKKVPERFDPLKKSFKYRFTELAPNFLSRNLSRSYFERCLRAMGFREFGFTLVDHHTAHAAAAAWFSGFPECLVLTLDGVGDGLSGSIREFRGGLLNLVHPLPAGTSLGIFFEHVTNLMNMRELEDEGKVMALADYAYPVPDSENPLLGLIRTEGLDVVSGYSSTAMFREMKKIFWRYPSEQFAYMAQRVLERNVLSLASAALRKTGLKNIAAAGGVFSNVKMNRKLAALEGVEHFFVFPHMGDGGLALGAAIAAAMGASLKVNSGASYRMDNLYLGPGFSNTDVLRALGESPDGDPDSASNALDWKKNVSGDLRFRQVGNVPEEAARLILGGEIVLWFQGRMEIGPRALGSRSILARPDNRALKDRLNLVLKKRVWYQPFCPSLLCEDASSLLQLEGQEAGDNRFMTMAYKVKPECLEKMAGVINIDGTCRPHFVADESPRFRELLLLIRKGLGYGAVLNTSFNIHGEPLVCTPAEAVDVLKRTGIRYLFAEDILIENLEPNSNNL